MPAKRVIHIGIDEVGRGPLAGPVTVAAVALPRNFQFLISNFQIKLKDSKKLSAKQREEWCAYIKNHPKIFYATASVYPKVIDRINISRAANLAATRALRRVVELMSCGRWPTVHELKGIRAYLDGGLYLNKIKNSSTAKLINCKTVIRGDEKYNCIKLASIVAKVKRDRIMKRSHLKYPDYGFDAHKGYGTKAHIAALKRHGPCRLHRLTFIKNLIRV